MNRYVVIGLIFTWIAAGSRGAAQVESEASRQELRETLQAAFPGPQQKELAKRVGQYTTVTKFWPKPNTEPLQDSGSSIITELLGGRFLLEESVNSMTAQPVSGTRMFGYNNTTQQYEASWVYAGSTAIVSLHGTSTDKGATVNYSGTLDDPNTRKDPFSVSIHQIDGDHFVVTMRIGSPDEPERSAFETSYTRKK